MASVDEDVVHQAEEKHSDSDASEDLDPRILITPTILAELKHLDLSGKLRTRAMALAGIGYYGDVLKVNVRIENRGKIAACAKRLRFHLHDDIKTLFEKEIYVWAKLKHPNILPLLGYAFDSLTGYPLLLSEWMVNGSAFEYVKANPGCDLMRIVTGIARGLAYLHNYKDGVIHSDIKPENVLITDLGDAVICDFGLTRMVRASKSLGQLSNSVHGTVQYYAFELLNFSDAKHTKESDVWAYGITVFELLTGKRAYGEGNLATYRAAAAILSMRLPTLPATLGNPVPPDVKDELWRICQLCWKKEPSERKSTDEILQRLERFLPSS